MRKYALSSALSGVLWAGIAWALSAPWIPSQWGGLLAAPAIGVVAGLAYLPVYRRPLWVRVIGALGTLYLSASLFGLAVGIAESMRDAGGPRDSTEVVLEGILGTLWGTTFTGFFLFLWPLAFVNHWLLGRLRTASRPGA